MMMIVIHPLPFFIRKIAQYSLETLGIDSKDQLKGVMQQLHMIPGDSRNGRNHLDVLLAREKKKEDTVKQVQMEGIKQWLQAMDPKCYLLKEKRPESSENTLCFPPIIHYNQHLKRLKYAHH